MYRIVHVSVPNNKVILVQQSKPSLTELLGIFSHSFWRKMLIAVGKMLLALHLHMHRLEIGFFLLLWCFPYSR